MSYVNHSDGLVLHKKAVEENSDRLYSVQAVAYSATANL